MPRVNGSRLAVAEFRLSERAERAERDLIEIYDYTEETFGAYQAEAYHSGLERTFDLFSSCPMVGRLKIATRLPIVVFEPLPDPEPDRPRKTVIPDANSSMLP